MSDRLRVDYAAVEGVIGNMKQCKEDIVEKYKQMMQIVESLVSEGYMEAESADSYVSEFKEMLGPDIKSLSDLINDFYEQLSKICQNFAEHDSKIAGMLF